MADEVAIAFITIFTLKFGNFMHRIILSPAVAEANIVAVTEIEKVQALVSDRTVFALEVSSKELHKGIISCIVVLKSFVLEYGVNCLLKVFGLYDGQKNIQGVQLPLEHLKELSYSLWLVAIWLCLSKVEHAEKE